VHEDNFDAAVAASVGDLTRSLDSHAHRIEALERRFDRETQR
jgi:hypothetical protein